MDFASTPLEQLIARGDTHCPCGRPHASGLSFVCIKPGATESLPVALRRAGIVRPFIVCDENTRRAAWQAVEGVLGKAGIPYALHTLAGSRIEPDERAMGSLSMAFDRQWDGVLAIGSGVINDCCKVLAQVAGVPSVAYATAPSMDGYASNSASMLRDGVKVTLYNPYPAAIVGDIDIIRGAPLRMLWAGLGDMLAKYVSVCEWRIAHLVTGEYYCENIAGLMRSSLHRIVKNAENLTRRDPAAVQAVMEGLVLSGIAMCFAQVSRPASGLEHYYSHAWEMMALRRGEMSDLHGIQVGVGTILAMRLLQKIRQTPPDQEKALSFVAAFDPMAWEAQTRAIFGDAAEALIDLEKNVCRKNDPKGHAERLERICANWPEIRRAIEEELPALEDVLALMRRLGMPATPEEIGVTPENEHNALIGSRDIRDKYITSSLLWDMGLLYDMRG